MLTIIYMYILLYMYIQILIQPNYMYFNNHIIQLYIQKGTKYNKMAYSTFTEQLFGYSRIAGIKHCCSSIKDFWCYVVTFCMDCHILHVTSSTFFDCNDYRGHSLWPQINVDDISITIFCQHNFHIIILLVLFCINYVKLQKLRYWFTVWTLWHLVYMYMYIWSHSILILRSSWMWTNMM